MGYCGKDFFNNYRSDNIKPIDFNESWIQKDELKSIILNKGSYLPILMFFDEDECISAIACVHTKYTLKCIEELFKENKLQNEKFLFIVKPTENIEIEMTKFILPRTLYE